MVERASWRTVASIMNGARTSLILLLFFGLIFPWPAWAADSQSLDAGYSHMYNLEFDAAHRVFGEWMRQHPEDPMGPVSDAAAYLFAELDRLHILQSEFFLHDDNFRTRKRLTPDPIVQQSFQRQIAKAEELASRTLAQSPKDASALLASVLASGLRSNYDALIEKRYLSSLAYTKNSRFAAEKLLAIDPNCADAWLAIGVENYLLSLKPLPLRWLLRWNGNVTDRTLGLEKLRITAEKGRYLKPFARLLLAVAALRDKDRDRARMLLQSLSRQFPKNQLYVQELSRLK